MPAPLPRGLILRRSQPDDHARIISVLKPWWGGRDLTWMLPRLFLNHFCNTSFVVEQGAVLVAFLVAFLSPARPQEGYIHFAGVHPDFRGQGVGSHLYQRFFEICRADGRRIVRACTSPVNKASVRFHKGMGFTLSEGNGCIEGLPVTLDYNRPDDPKVLFERVL